MTWIDGAMVRRNTKCYDESLENRLKDLKENTVVSVSDEGRLEKKPGSGTIYCKISFDDTIGWTKVEELAMSESKWKKLFDEKYIKLEACDPNGSRKGLYKFKFS